MDRDRERDRDRRFVKPTPPYARQHSTPAIQCTHHAQSRRLLTFAAETTDTRTRIDHVLPGPEADLLGGIATAPVDHHHRVAALPHDEARRPVAALPPPTPTHPEATVARHGPGAARQRLEDGHAVRVEMTTGGPGRVHHPAATSPRDAKSSGTIALGRRGGMGTIHTLARHGRVTGHHHRGPVKPRQLGAGACVHPYDHLGTMNHVRASAG